MDNGLIFPYRQSSAHDEPGTQRVFKNSSEKSNKVEKNYHQKTEIMNNNKKILVRK